MLPQPRGHAEPSQSRPPAAGSPCQPRRHNQSEGTHRPPGRAGQLDELACTVEGQKKAQIYSILKRGVQQFASRMSLAWHLGQSAMAGVVLQGSSSVPRAAHTPSASNAKVLCKPFEGAFPMRGSEDWPHVTHCSTMATLHATNGCYV